VWLSRVILTAILAFVALIADQSGFLRHFDDRLVEARMRLAPREATNGILLVDIDAKSIAAIGRWPWPRRTYAQTIDRLREMQASLIALDIDLSSASTEPEDAELEAALQRAADTVVLVAFSRRATASPMDADIAESEPLERFGRYAWLANVNVTQDSDGFVRQFSFAEVIGGEVVPTLPTLFSGAAGSVGDSYLIDFSIRANTIDRISLVDLVRGDVHADRIRGKNVIIGAEATELRDFFNVPVAGVVSGPMLQALATELWRSIAHSVPSHPSSRSLASSYCSFLPCGRLADCH
jgi:CHASE2 domain-containing sensor protein